MEAFRRQIYPRKSNTFSEAYRKANMRPHGYLVADSYPMNTFSEVYKKATMRPDGYLGADLYPMTLDSRRLETNIFPCENNQFHPNDIFHTISPIVESFKKKNCMESSEL